MPGRAATAKVMVIVQRTGWVCVMSANAQESGTAAWRNGVSAEVNS